MRQLEKWNKDNLIKVNSEEYQYMDFIELIEEKINTIKQEFYGNILMETYYDIINERDKVKKLDKLQRIYGLLGEIDKILKVDEEEI